MARTAMPEPWMAGALPWSVFIDSDSRISALCRSCNSGCRGASSIHEAFNILASGCSCPEAVSAWQAIRLIRWLARMERKPEVRADSRESAGRASDRTESKDFRPARRCEHISYPEQPRPGTWQYDMLDRRDFKRRCMQYDRSAGWMDPDAHGAWGLALANESRARMRADHIRGGLFF